MGRIRFVMQQGVPDAVVQLRRAPDRHPDLAGHHTGGAETFGLDDEDVESRFVSCPDG